MRPFSLAWFAWVSIWVFLGACATNVVLPPPAPPAQTADAAAPEPPAKPRHITPLPYNSAFIHVDMSFSAEEREHIRNAATAWNLFSLGEAKLVTADDLDTDGLAPDVHRILRINSVNAKTLVDMVDAEHPGYKVLAFCQVPTHPWASRRIYIIMDRVDPDQFMWIVAHEMGHFLGLDDIQSTGDIMSGVGRFKSDWFTPSDLRECQAAKVCK